MIHRWPYVILSAFLFAISVGAISCGDVQDPAPGSSGGVTVISNPTEAGFTNLAEITEAQSNAMTEPNISTVPSMEPSSAGTSGRVPSPDTPRMRTVTLSWDPSQDALGYKVHLIGISVSLQHIIDTGRGTTLCVPLRVGENYAFTVIAYNASGESPPANFVYFYVS